MTGEQDQIKEMLWQKWMDCLNDTPSPDDDRIIAPIQKLIATTRDIMREAGRDTVNQHNFFATLLFHVRRVLKHPPTSHFVRFLQIETEFD